MLLRSGLHNPGCVYMLPSRASEDILLDIICELRGEGGYFGERAAVWDWAGMYRALSSRAKLRRQIDPPDHRLILKYITDRGLGELDRLGIEVPKGAVRRGFIDILSDAVRELLLEDVAPDMLLCGKEPEGLADDGTSGKITSRDLLYRLYTDYLIYLEEHGLADNSQLPALARSSLCTDGLPPAFPSRIVWIGFLSFTGSQLKLVRSLAESGTDMDFFVPDCGLELFHDAASQLNLQTTKRVKQSMPVMRISAPGPYEQYELLAAEIAKRYFEEENPDIGILVPSGALELIESELSALSVPVQKRAEIPISDTAVMDILRRIWACYEQGWPFAKTLSLLSSPCLEIRRVFQDGMNRRRAATAVPEGAAQWRGLLAASGGAGAVKFFERLEAFCEYMDAPAGHTAEELLRALLEFVRGSGSGWDFELSAIALEHTDFDGAVRETASAIVEISEKIEMFSELAPPLGEASSVRFSGSGAIAYLGEWSRETTAAIPPPKRGAVVLYGSYPPVLASHDIWAMTDVDPSNFPGSSAEQLLLDGRTRDEVNSSRTDGVHLPTLHEKREQSEAVFRRLIAVGERLAIVSRSLTDSRGRPQGESPFLLSYLEDTGCADAGEAKTSSGEGQSLLAARGARALYRGEFPRIAGWRLERGQKVRVGASHVDEWLKCPFLYWCTRLARIERPRDVLEVFGRIEQGNLLHEIWRRVYERYAKQGGSGSLHGSLLASWEEIVAGLERSVPLLADPRAALTISGLRSKMLEIAVLFDEIEERAETAGIMRGETVLEFELPEYELNNAVFVGYADRIDYWEGVGSVILDYKLGSSAWIKDSVQLACYSAMMSRGTGDVAGYCYVSHSDAKITGAWNDELYTVYRKRRNKKAVAIDEKVDEAFRVMEEMDEAIGKGEFPARYDSPVCPRCPYQMICRRGERFGFSAGDDEDGAEEEQ